MFKIKKHWLLIAFCALILCITQIAHTYAKYIDVKEGNTDFEIAGWKILLNNQDITEASTMSSLITPVYISNANIKDGVIAPTSEGYFDLTIDSTNTDVSFKYDITVSTSDTSAVTDLKITGYKLNNGDLINENTVSNKVLYSESKKINTIRVYFTWDDSDTSTMDNEEDTNASLSGNKAQLKVNITFTQITN